MSEGSVGQAAGSDPLWPGPRDLAARLDRLEDRLADLEGLRPAVEAAMVAQASRIEAVLSAARRDLAETVVGDHLRSALAQALADGEDRLAEVQAAVAASTTPMEALAGAVESLHERAAAVVDDATDNREEVGRLVEQVAHLGEQHDAALAQLRTATDRAIDQIQQTATDATAAVAARLEEAGRRSERAVEAIQGLQEAVTAQLDDLERRATLERARLTGAFVEQLADGLTRRERKRLAKRLEVPEPAPLPPAEPAPEPEPAPAPAAGPTAADVPAPPSSDADAPPAAATDPAAPEAPATPPTPPVRRVQPSRRTRPVRATASTPQDPAATRRALAAVRGLGQARQSALIDRFGTLAGIRDASDDELLEVRGIGPSLLPAIRDAVGTSD